MRFFKQISLSTPESVELEFTLAGIGNRAFALLIDYNIMGLIQGVFIVLWGWFSSGLLSNLENSGGDYSAVPIWLAAIGFLASFVIFTGYFAFFEVLWQGQTPGKRLVKIRVIREDGSPIGMAQATLRSLLRPIDDFFFAGVFFILFNSREKRVGDLVAGTIVIQEERPDPKANFVFSKRAEELAIELTTMANLQELLPDDFAVVRSYLQRRSRMATRARNDLSMQLARQLKTLIQLEAVPPNTTSDQFLEAIYLAYQKQVDGIEPG